MSNQQHRARCTATRQVTINDGNIILTERQNAFDPARAPDDDQECQRAPKSFAIHDHQQRKVQENHYHGQGSR